MQKMDSDETNYRTTFSLIAAAMCIASTFSLLWCYNVRPQNILEFKSIEWYSLVSTVFMGMSTALLLGPHEEIWVPFAMLGLSVAALIFSLFKLGFEMRRAQAYFYYNMNLNGQVRFFTPKHLLDLLLPLSFIVFSATYLYVLKKEGSFGWHIRIPFRGVMVVIMCMAAVSNQIKELIRKFYEWNSMDETLVQLMQQHNIPREFHDVIFGDPDVQASRLNDPETPGVGNPETPRLGNSETPQVGDQISNPGALQVQVDDPVSNQEAPSGGDQEAPSGGDQISNPGALQVQVDDPVSNQEAPPGGDQEAPSGGDQEAPPPETHDDPKAPPGGDQEAPPPETPDNPKHHQ